VIANGRREPRGAIRRHEVGPREPSPTALAALFTSPALAVIFLTILFPLGYAVYLSLHMWNLKRPMRPFVGLRNYLNQLTSDTFWSSLGTTFIFTIGAVAAIVVVGLLIALLLDQDFMGRGLLRGLLLVPWAVPPVVNGLLWKWLLDPGYGIVNGLLKGVGAIDSYQSWLTSMPSAMLWVIAAYTWTHVPLAALLTLAGLQTIPGELYEAATIDGASIGQRFRRVTLPLLMPTLVVVLIFETIFALKVFDVIYVLTGGGPGNATTVLGWQIYTKTFHQLDFGNGSALAIILGVLTLLVAVGYFSLLNRGDHA
jgi:multiple sugar transport system permease protein